MGLIEAPIYKIGLSGGSGSYLTGGVDPDYDPDASPTGNIVAYAGISQGSVAAVPSVINQ